MANDNKLLGNFELTGIAPAPRGLDENLMELGVIWRFKKKNGLDYSEDYRVYEQKLANEMARVGGKKTLSMNGGNMSINSNNSGGAGITGWSNLQTNWNEIG